MQTKQFLKRFLLSVIFGSFLALGGDHDKDKEKQTPPVADRRNSPGVSASNGESGQGNGSDNNDNEKDDKDKADRERRDNKDKDSKKEDKREDKEDKEDKKEGKDTDKPKDNGSSRTKGPRTPAQKLAKDLAGMEPDALVEVVIRFQQAPTEQQLTDMLNRGGKLLQELPFINAAVYRIRASNLDTLAGDAGVEYMTPNRKIRATLDHATPATAADLVHSYGWTGKGISIAVIDSGINSHPDLMNSTGDVSRIVYEKSFIADDPSTRDAYGHGTHIAGIIAGSANRSTGTGFSRTFRGMAPEANLLNLRVLNAKGEGTDTAVIAAIQEAIALKAKYNIRAINLSLGRPIVESFLDDPLCQAVEAAWKA